MNAEQALLAGIAAEPCGEGWLVLADYWDEMDDRRGELTRLLYDPRRIASLSDDERSDRIIALWNAGVGPVCVTVTGSFGTEYVWIPQGRFWMGASEGDTEAFDDEKPRHEVTLTKGVYLSKYAVTRGQYAAFVKETTHDAGEDWRSPGFAQTDAHPVVNVSWEDAVAFCRWLSEKENAAIRLPTEAEWEYACRAGTTPPRYNGGGKDRLKDIASFDANTFDATHPVGELRPNAWGLHDMLGGVWEWCFDVWSDKYLANKCTDPAGPANGPFRVSRGGSWNDVARRGRASFRSWSGPAIRISNLGFRVARSSVVS